MKNETSFVFDRLTDRKRNIGNTTPSPSPIELKRNSSGLLTSYLPKIFKRVDRIFGRKFRPYKKVIRLGNRWQVVKFKDRVNKGEFPTDITELYFLLQGEVEELGKAIIDEMMDERIVFEIEREAADIANYAHLIIWARRNR